MNASGGQLSSEDILGVFERFLDRQVQGVARRPPTLASRHQNGQETLQ
jgi:hypothetical protein